MSRRRRLLALISRAAVKLAQAGMTLLALAVGLAIGFGFMFAVGAYGLTLLSAALHDNVASATPTVGYWTAFALVTGAGLVALGVSAPVVYVLGNRLEAALRPLTRVQAARR